MFGVSIDTPPGPSKGLTEVEELVVWTLEEAVVPDVCVAEAVFFEGGAAAVASEFSVLSAMKWELGKEDKP